MYGAHDYNAAAFILMGVETLVHDKPKNVVLLKNTVAKVGYLALRSNTTVRGQCG